MQTTRCKATGCPTKVAGQDYCSIHTQANKNEQRATAGQRGYDYQWQCYRAAFLKYEPFCWSCRAEGKLTKATVVDHIKPIENGQHDKLFWDKANHQALCRDCHSYKTRVIDKRGYGARA